MKSESFDPDPSTLAIELSGYLFDRAEKPFLNATQKPGLFFTTNLQHVTSFSCPVFSLTTWLYPLKDPGDRTDLKVKATAGSFSFFLSISITESQIFLSWPELPPRGPFGPTDFALLLSRSFLAANAFLYLEHKTF